MKKPAKIVLDLIANIEIMHNCMLRRIINAVRLIRQKAQRLPVIVQYNGLGGLKLLREVSEILDSLDLNHFIVGGFAYDIKSCRLSRTHGDLDVAVLTDSTSDSIEEQFRKHGYSVTRGQDYRLIKHGRSVDLFLWYMKDDGFVFKQCGNIIVNMPLSYFAYEIKDFSGYQYKIACNEYIVCIEPFVQNPLSLAYIQSLKQSLSKISCKQSYEEATQSLTVYNYYLEGAPSKRTTQSIEPASAAR